VIGGAVEASRSSIAGGTDKGMASKLKHVLIGLNLLEWA
jgi:hypothetical protein